MQGALNVPAQEPGDESPDHTGNVKGLHRVLDNVP